MNRSPRKTVAVLAASAALLLPLAGCGGDDDKPSSASSSTLDPVTAAYVASVEPMCLSIQEDLAAISAAYSKEPTPEQFKEGLQQASTVILTEIDDIKAVATPPELADRVAGWLDALEKAAKRMPKLTAADAEAGIDVFESSDLHAQELGLGPCTSNGE